MVQFINKLIHLFKNTNPNETTIERFHEWLINNEQTAEKEEALKHLWKEPTDISKDDALKALEQFKSKNRPKQLKNRRLALWQYAAAAVIIACITTAYLFTINIAPPNVIYTENSSLIGETNTIKLPDGSTVMINSSSILLYPEDFGKKSRTIYLTGEANFQVSRNEKIPFIVKSKNFSVTALGTEFNVSSYPNEDYYKATLIEGSIQIENQEKSIDQILEIEDQFTYNKSTNEYSINKTNLEDVTAWQRGELVFRGATVKDIVQVLEREYNIIFHNQSKDTDFYTFKFQKNTPLEKVLQVMKNVMDGFNYVLKDNICYIY